MNQRHLLLPILGAMISSCGSSTPPPAEVTAAPATVTSSPASMPLEKEIVEDAGLPNVILRTDLHAVLAAGPAAILSKVETAPVFKDGRFLGFRIVALSKPPSPVIDLRVEDVILSVNGKSVERPEGFYEIIETLKTADEIRFSVVREGVAQTLVYPIGD
ncbi:MAG: hypothetical protein QNJ97_09465 [Myxococcota bacterium]|nr:hypothetical protein [Myxococcota bacterium]